MEAVKVMIRVRPLNSMERDQSTLESIEVFPPQCQIDLIKSDKSGVQRKPFFYDKVFDQTLDQQTVYESSAFQLVESTIEGYNTTIFVYGQTSSGKTFTMMGDPDNEKFQGIIPRSFSHIISAIGSAPETKTFLIRVSYFEIYNEEIKDLLQENKAKLELREKPSGFYVKDLTQLIVNSREELIKVLRIGNKRRAVGETKMNEQSSRSHSVFVVNIESSEILEGGLKPKIVSGKLNLVDLAGSERQNKTGVTGDRLKESTKINLSLSALGNVISALVDGKTNHIPYRDSKLTKILQDSLGGNTKTIMIATISPAISNYDETLGTLRYATRAKMIKNKPKINEDPKDAIIRMYADEIKKLKEMLERGGGGKNDAMELGEIEKILEENKILTLKQQKLEEELRNKDNNSLDKNDVNNILNNIQGNFIIGKNEENDKKKLNLLRKKLKKQNKMQEELMNEKKLQDEALENIEKQFISKQEEVAEYKKVNKIVWEKYKNSLREINDLNLEHEYEKECLLDTIREQEKDIQFYEDVLNYILTDEEINKIRNRTMWSEIQNKYKVPPFVFKENSIKFPNLTFEQSKNLVENQQKSRVMEIIEQEEKKNSGANSSNDEDEKSESSQKKGKSKKISVKIGPIKAIHPKENKEAPSKILKYKSNYNNNENNNDDSPNFVSKTHKKLDYLRSLDTMIDSYTKKYSKDKLIFPQNYSIVGFNSFTDLADLEKDIAIQTIKAKKNLNNLLEPISKNENIIQELIDENIENSSNLRKGHHEKKPSYNSNKKYEIKTPFPGNFLPNLNSAKPNSIKPFGYIEKNKRTSLIKI